MKLRKQPYLINLIRENAAYIIVSMTLTILMIGLIYYNTVKIVQNQETISSLTKDIQVLQSRSTILN